MMTEEHTRVRMVLLFLKQNSGGFHTRAHTLQKKLPLIFDFLKVSTAVLQTPPHLSSSALCRQHPGQECLVMPVEGHALPTETSAEKLNWLVYFKKNTRNNTH